MNPQTDTVLQVEHLDVTIFTKGQQLPVVRDVSFSLARGKTLGIVGESGSGKSMTALSIMRLIEEPLCRITGGAVLFDGKDMTKEKEKQLQALRGNRIAMIFQEPMTSLNPILRVGFQISEALHRHRGMSWREAKAESIRLLELVNIPIPDRRYQEYPYQLSGGMRQRVMIAIALACNPEVLICDEPTTALDVTIQAQILSLIASIQKELGTAVLLITHDMGVVRESTDEVVVMYAGKIMERAPTAALFEAPLHPYTSGLIASIPKLSETKERLTEIPGDVPMLDSLPQGCLYHERCPYARELCRRISPELTEQADGRAVRCLQYTSAWTEEGESE